MTTAFNVIAQIDRAIDALSVAAAMLPFDHALLTEIANLCRIRYRIAGSDSPIPEKKEDEVHTA